MRKWLGRFAPLLVHFIAAIARAQAVPSPPMPPDAALPQAAPLASSTELVDEQKLAPAPAAAPSQPFKLGAYVELFYQWNFERPSNAITHYRAFDNRHNTFTLANAALDAQWDYEGVIGQLTLQVGHTPSTYYLSEPQQEATSGANGSGSELWKYLQQAYAGYRFYEVLTVTVGLFLSPIGPEPMAIKDNWNWSRSNLFFGLPFYHTGARATYAWGDGWAFGLAALNGWNSVVDNNARKSVALQLTLTRVKLATSLLYLGGVERARGAAEEQPWRHMLDAHGTWHSTAWLSLSLQLNAGLERNRFGDSRWIATAAYLRAQLLKPLFLALRGDFFREHVARNERGMAQAMFWPVSWVSAATATLDYRPHAQVSFRAEYRHDQGQAPLYFGGSVERDAATAAYLPNRRAQDTFTLGTTAWF